MKVITHLISFIIAFSVASEGNHIEQITVPLSNPDGPGILVLNHHKGSLNITGYAGNLVIVRASMRYRADESTSDDKNIYLGAVENNNSIIVNVAPRYRTIDMDILVPKKLSVRLKNDDSGVISIEHLSGEIEVSNLNSDILLTDISGAAVLDTVDGNIKAQFKNIPPGVPMAFSTVEGNIEVTFPEKLNALIRARCDQGIIHNDFVRSAAAGEKQPTQSSGEQIDVGGWRYHKINHGGPEIRLMSFLGNIDIKCSKSR